MEMPDFWDVPELSQKKTIELNALKSDLEVYNKLISEKEDMETLIEMGYEEEDPELIPEIQEMLILSKHLRTSASRLCCMASMTKMMPS